MFWSGKTPLTPPRVLAELGYRIMIVPSDLQRAAIWAMKRASEVIRQHGNTVSIAAEVVSFSEREACVGLSDIEELQKQFL
jgi:2-methylisocitrate lyase-like PEP mutase family enzyme